MARILVVEDDGALRNDISDKLEEWGHEVHQAGNGALAFNLIEQVRPDLVLCDICLPCENGFELVKKIKEKSIDNAHMAIIFISSLAETKAKIYGAHCGIDDYIVKPIDYTVLGAKIALHLNKTNGLVARFAKLLVKQSDRRTIEAVNFVERRVVPNLSRSFGRRKTDP